MSKFQIITISIFVICIIAGIAAFALYKGDSSTTTLPSITIWGTFSKDSFDQYVSNINNTLQQQISIKYVEEPATSFTSDFVSALARGQGPDAILIPAELLLPNEDKLALIPFSSLSQRTLLDTYVKEAGLYVNQSGILGLPFMMDPLVMYWNRDMLDSAGIARAPQYWDDFTPINKALTVKDQNGNVRRSAIALGVFGNVDNAREILGTLLMQSGNPVTKLTPEGSIVSTIKTSASVSPTAALQFFTKFVDPTNPDYSWNRSLPSSKAAFLSGSLATYFGFASELGDLKDKNPNLNFDISMLPQVRTGGVKTTYGRMYGFSMVRTSQNLNTVFSVINTLTTTQPLADLSNKLYLPSVRRDVIAAGSNDPYISLFNQAALVSNTWLDADINRSYQIFGNMVYSLTSGQKTIYQAIQDAGDQYDIVLGQAVSQ